jgi:hypothetical protein
MRNAYKILVEKPEVERPLGKYGRRWDDNIEMDRFISKYGGRVLNPCIRLRMVTIGGPL